MLNVNLILIMSIEIENSFPKTTTLGPPIYLVIIFRLIIASILALVGYFYLFRRLTKIRQRNALIDKLPGPPPFNPVMGNLPMEVLKYVGSDYEASKHLYSSKFVR